MHGAQRAVHAGELAAGSGGVGRAACMGASPLRPALH